MTIILDWYLWVLFVMTLNIRAMLNDPGARVTPRQFPAQRSILLRLLSLFLHTVVNPGTTHFYQQYSLFFVINNARIYPVGTYDSVLSVDLDIPESLLLLLLLLELSCAWQRSFSKVFWHWDKSRKIMNDLSRIGVEWDASSRTNQNQFSVSQLIQLRASRVVAKIRSSFHMSDLCSFYSHWLKNWCEIFQPITKRNDSVITLPSYWKIHGVAACTDQVEKSKKTKGVARGGSRGARDPLFCKPFLTKQPTTGGENAMTIFWP